MNKYIYIKETGQVAGPLTMEEPDFKSADWFSPFEQWVNHLELLPRIDIVGEHSFLDGQILEIGKDIELHYEAEMPPYAMTNKGIRGTETWFAIPLKQVQKEKDFEPEVHSSNKASVATLACTSGNNIEQTIEAIKKVTKEACKSKESALQFLKDAGIINDEFMLIKWVNAVDRLPVLPNPLPANTDDERGVLFVNRVHSSCFFWYPSYGRESSATLASCAASGEGWELDKWEWLEELAASQEVKGNATQQGWISVKDRKPEHKERVLAFGKRGKDEVMITARFHADNEYNEEGWYYNCQGGVDFTHWMPLPEKPNSEQGVAQRELSVANTLNHGSEPMANNNSFTEEDLLELIRFCAEKGVRKNDISYYWFDRFGTTTKITPKEILTNFLKQQKGV